jgi:hypothetical protein
MLGEMSSTGDYGGAFSRATAGVTAGNLGPG